DRVRTRRRDDRHARYARLAIGRPVRIAPEVWIEQILNECGRLLDEVHLHEMRSRLDGHAELQRFPDSLGALLPADIRDIRAADHRRPDPGAVEAHVQLLRLRSDPDDAAVRSAFLQLQLELVVAVDGKVVPERRAAPRSPGLIVAEADALVAIARHEDRFRRSRA